MKYKKIVSLKFFVLLLVTILPLVVLGASQVFAQDGPETDGGAAIYRGVSTAVKFDISPPLRDMEPLPVEPRDGFEIPERATGLEGAPGPQDADAVLQGEAGPDLIPGPIVSFDGPPNVFGVSPPDPVGDVGPNHYVAMSNLSFQIFNKTGTSLFGPAANNTLWAGFGGDCETDNAGDPIVIYDQLDDRWILSQFTSSGPTFFNCVAVSQSGDPVGSYYRYAFSTGANFPDYPKYGMWPDALYISTREFLGASFAGVGAYAVNRADLIAGNPVTMISFLVPPGGTPYNIGDGLLPTDLDGSTLPPPGSPNYFVGTMDNGGPYGAPMDALTLWKFHADFAVPANSTFTLDPLIPVAAFDSIYPCSPGARDCIPQPGTANKVDILSYRQRPMWRLAYRNFGTHESLVTNQSVEAAPSMAGIRWYEIRDPDGTPTIHQQGTYAPGVSDGIHRWMGSIAMDQAGNMALGYSASDAVSTFPSSWYTGRLAGDPLGTMPQGEESIIDGTGSQTGSQRWGDYTSMNVDPVDDCTFWYVNQYLPATSPVGWVLRIGAFKFPDCGPSIAVDPAAVASTQAPNAVITQTLTVSNTGTGDLDWSIFEDGQPRPQVDWSDNFDSYATGSQMHGQGGWKGWDNDPSFGALTSAVQARSAPNSVDILGASDLVHEYTGSTSGLWTYTAWQYIPSGFSGTSYFILLNTYNDGGAKNWSTEVNFNSGSGLVVNDGVSGGTLPLVTDQWVELRVEIDLDSDTQDFYYDNQLMYSGSWTGEVSGGGALNIAAVDFYANSASSVYYDDMSLAGPPPPACDAPSDIPWVSASPLSGSTPGGGADDVSVVFDSTGLSAGSFYTGTLCVSSNDTANPLVTVPLTLTVTTPSYGVAVSGDQALSGDLGTTITYTVMVTNTGNVADTFDLTLSGNAWMSSLSQSTLLLNPGGSGAVEVYVQVPGSASYPNTDTVAFTATSQGDAGASDTADLISTAVWPYHLYLPIINKNS